ncbi:MAG: tetratricopeptide repeat protein, partial [Deltaproteobacteria bacterium]|nr:tetratricopeptide repeat protein [Deltaproteobacteria bacterium]
MIPCLDENSVAAFLDGALPTESTSEVEQHIESCPSCRRLVAAVVRGERAEDPPDTLPEPEAEPEPGPLVRGAVVGRYVVIDLLGAGGMGVVYAAYDPTLERKIALKCVRPRATGSADSGEVSARLLREGKVIAQLSHPHIVAVHDMGTFRDQVFIAMELVDGGTLKSWLLEKRRTWHEVLDAFRAAGKGLAAAHHAGLLHRDFKPENVLLGRDGRIRVTDFGLASAVERASAPSEPNLPIPLPIPTTDEAWSPSFMTRTGTLVGTLAYMAPELFSGQRADALSDQFSFCVALWEALFGVRPYPPPKPGDPAWEQHRIEEPKDSGVPGWLASAVARGLSRDPQARFADMEQLLTALEADPRQALRRAVGMGAGVALALALAIVGATWAATRTSRLCQGVREQADSLWNPTLQHTLESAFLSTGHVDAPLVWERVRAELDRFWTGWAQMRGDACEATRIRGEQSDQVLGLRMACLDRRRSEAQSLLELYAHADREVVAKAAEAVNLLPPLERCADVEALAAAVPPPDDAAARAQVEQARARLGDAQARLDIGKYAEAVSLATQAVTFTRTLGYPPVLAEALLLLGRGQAQIGELRPAEGFLLEALVTGQASKADEVAARAATELSLVLGARQARFSEAHTWSSLAEAAITRIGGNEELKANLQRTEGLVLYAEGRVSQAIEKHQQALALYEKRFPESLLLADSLNDLGAALRGDGQANEALVSFRRASSIFEKKLGPESDKVATSQNGIGNVLMSEGRFEEALAAYRQALKTFEKTLGTDHFRTVTTLNNVGVVFAEQGRFTEALPYFERVLHARETTLGPANAKVADAHGSVGMLLVELGRLDEGWAHFEKAKGILQGFPLDHFSQAEYLAGFGSIDLARGQARKALAPLER